LYAQDVTQAARQERARKAAQKNSPKHVYTDDDLKKKKILTPEDEAKVALRKQQHEETSPHAAGKKPQPAGEPAQAESLGEVARSYRNQKAARPAEQAATKSYRPFHYEVPQERSGAPKASVEPMSGVAPDAKRPNFSDVIRPIVPKKVPPSSSASAHGRVSPFQPRTLVVPRRPVTVNPAPAPPAPAVAVSRPATPVAHLAFGLSPKAGLRTITVQPGDSWWKLATVYLGSGSRWTELFSLNRDQQSSPELLESGARVLLPEGKKIHVDSSRQSQVRIKAGDTLWVLAREHLGRASAWTCLANANPQIQNYQHMAIGTVLEIPQPNDAGSCKVISAGQQ
jgi:nucleoid-associated protein YgaU